MIAPNPKIDYILGCRRRTASAPRAGVSPGDVPATYADVADLEDAVGFRPATPLREGLTRFVNWYRDYYRE